HRLPRQHRRSSPVHDRVRRPGRQGRAGGVRRAGRRARGGVRREVRTDAAPARPRGEGGAPPRMTQVARGRLRLWLVLVAVLVVLVAVAVALPRLLGGGGSGPVPLYEVRTGAVGADPTLAWETDIPSPGEVYS